MPDKPELSTEVEQPSPLDAVPMLTRAFIEAGGAGLIPVLIIGKTTDKFGMWYLVTNMASKTADVWWIHEKGIRDA